MSGAVQPEAAINHRQFDAADNPPRWYEFPGAGVEFRPRESIADAVLIGLFGGAPEIILRSLTKLMTTRRPAANWLATKAASCAPAFDENFDVPRKPILEESLSRLSRENCEGSTWITEKGETLGGRLPTGDCITISPEYLAANADASDGEPAKMTWLAV
jgi:hypothetical protein